MKPTRSFNLVEVVFLAILVAGLNASWAITQVHNGKFSFPFEASWGQTVPPSDDFSLTLGHARIVGPPCRTMNQPFSKVAHCSALMALRAGGEYSIRALQLAVLGSSLHYLVPEGERQILALAPQLMQEVLAAMGSNRAPLYGPIGGPSLLPPPRQRQGEPATDPIPGNLWLLDPNPLRK